tara:strand:+ start:36206 stop:37447 length:1242 start_codon:yes stop_codon:yes gene_type:complete
MDIKVIAKRIKQASKSLLTISTKEKQTILKEISSEIIKNQENIKLANKKDVEGARDKGLSEAMIDRLALNNKRIKSMADSINELCTLPDPVGEITEDYERPNGIRVQRRRIPLGVIGVVYESRPNVTIEAASLCFYSGNGLLLRGGSEAFQSNIELVKIFKSILINYGLENVVDIIPSTDRSNIEKMAKLNKLLEVIIPRGGESLIKHIYKVSSVPIIAHYKGNCHVYVDASAKIKSAIKIVLNGKIQRPGVCNAVETLLVHKDIADKLMPSLIEKLVLENVEVRGCEKTQSFSGKVKKVSDNDYREEFLDRILAVKIVNSINESIDHIQMFGSDHTEAIISQNQESIDLFIKTLDSSAIIVNASTRFNDGGQLGLGAEIGISTTKLHSFGPMGLRELTSTKFVVIGSGQIRV